MFTRVFNLIFASVGSLGCFLDLVTRTDSRDAMGLLVTFIIFCWLVSAIGLCFRSRLAWYGSLLGVGQMFAGSVTTFASGLQLSPAAMDPTDGVGYSVVFGFCGIIVSLAVLIGLLLLRREWPHGAGVLPNQPDTSTPR